MNQSGSEYVRERWFVLMRELAPDSSDDQLQKVWEECQEEAIKRGWPPLLSRESENK